MPPRNRFNLKPLLSLEECEFVADYAAELLMFPQPQGWCDCSNMTITASLDEELMNALEQFAGVMTERFINKEIKDA